jgi:hypothetical protein
MSGRLGPGNLLFDHGQPLRKMGMDHAARPPAMPPPEVTVDADAAMREDERQQLAKLVPNLYRL